MAIKGAQQKLNAKDMEEEEKLWQVNTEKLFCLTLREEKRERENTNDEEKLWHVKTEKNFF